MFRNAIMLAETTATDPTVIPEAFKTAVSWVIGNVGTVMTTVTSNAILCLGVAVWAVGSGIGLFKRLV